MQTFVVEENDPVTFITDYDLPTHPESRRRAFYRRLTKLKRKMGLFGGMSTQSVLITIDRELAETIYRLALQHGAKANIYIAKKSDTLVGLTHV